MWDYREIQIDGTTDTWMVGDRLDKPGEHLFWATNGKTSVAPASTAWTTDDCPEEYKEEFQKRMAFLMSHGVSKQESKRQAKKTVEKLMRMNTNLQ